MSAEEGRFAGLTITTHEQLAEQINYVLEHPEIGGFDCLLARTILEPSEKTKIHAVGWATRGVKVSLQVHQDEEAQTPFAKVRVFITPPIKIKA